MPITAEMLLKNKGILKERTGEKQGSIVLKELKKKLGDGEVKFKSTTMDRIHDLSKQCSDNDYKLTCMIVYDSLVEPNLKDKELQKGYECKATPYKIVEELFTAREVKIIGDKISNLSDIPDTKMKENEIIEEIKNE